MPRRDKINYYLDIAEAVSRRSTCLNRLSGAIIVKNDEIVSTGYSGAPRGRKNCTDLGFCRREKYLSAGEERFELCRSVHAEANAIISASRRECLGATLYLVFVNPATGEYIPDSVPCTVCRRLIINAGLTTVIVRNTATEFTVTDVDAEWVGRDDTLDKAF